MNKQITNKPSPAFTGVSWLVLITGIVTYCIGLWNAEMQLNEKGYYLTVFVFGLSSVISLQKSVRDQLEDIPVTTFYFGLNWFTTILAILLLVIGLWNAKLALSEKGFYGIAFLMSMFAAIAVQKNVRDLQNAEHESKKDYLPDHDKAARAGSIKI